VAFAEELGAELVEITDGVNRSGFFGAVRSCFDAVRKSTRFLEPFQTEKAVKDYNLVLIGTPIWAGRCCSIVREFLKKYGKECQKAAYIITRSVEKDHQEQVFIQMDSYLTRQHICAASIRSGSVGETFWRERFVQELKEKLAEEIGVQQTDGE
jgi:menaquinone-dependent protoporphyrinogen IX oxidase